MFNRLIRPAVFNGSKFLLNINGLNYIYLLYFCALICIKSVMFLRTNTQWFC